MYYGNLRKHRQYSSAGPATALSLVPGGHYSKALETLTRIRTPWDGSLRAIPGHHAKSPQ